MATSGTIRPSSNGIFIKWSLASQSVANNTSTVSVTFGWGFQGAPLDRQLDNGVLRINGTVVYQNTGRVKNYTGDHTARDHTVWSGSRTISHNSSGAATLTLSGGMTGYSGHRSEGSASYALTNIPRLPGTPGVPSVSGHTDSDPTTASFSWTAPSNVGAGLDRRQIIVSRTTDPLVGPYVINDVANWGTTFSATGLPKGTTLYASVRAISNDAGWASFSANRTFTTGTTVPSTPATPTLSGIGGSSMTVSWTAPSDTGGGNITSYEVQRATSSTFSGAVSTTLTGGSRSLQVTGLAHTTTYYYRVRATNDSGKVSAWSAAASATTLATAPAAPPAPAATSRQATSLTVEWSAPADSGGAAVTGYQVQWSTSASMSAPSSATTASPSLTIANLNPSTQYHVRVRAVNSVGSGTYGAATALRTTSGLRVANPAGTEWQEADVWLSVAVPGGYEWRRCLVKPLGA
ncbi:fibronectin type III domain-containing protein [Micromonospora sp. NBC_01813]|uniref:fibronectin type III domain-containing protein n=1 Tax=Micromonospora sp. NBC_01813 TaxID=2975988 RepID=UPI002DDAA0FB|nr:fibronectin type III domain-containing protein [Micromonospora sp. NBC_01813]WSA11560.1 fibronectin type III domain-containing protein [Micromonospora sp. NBC_01813]